MNDSPCIECTWCDSENCTCPLLEMWCQYSKEQSENELKKIKTSEVELE